MTFRFDLDKKQSHEMALDKTGGFRLLERASKGNKLCRAGRSKSGMGKIPYSVRLASRLIVGLCQEI